MQQGTLSVDSRGASGPQRRFHLADQGTTIRTEILAGTTTFLTMAYIIIRAAGGAQRVPQARHRARARSALARVSVRRPVPPSVRRAQVTAHDGAES